MFKFLTFCLALTIVFSSYKSFADGHKNKKGPDTNRSDITQPIVSAPLGQKKNSEENPEENPEVVEIPRVKLGTILSDVESSLINIKSSSHPDIITIDVFNFIVDIIN